MTAGSIVSCRVVRSTIAAKPVAIRIADEQLEQEPVELGFRQGVGPLLLDRVCVAMTRNGRFNW